MDLSRFIGARIIEIEASPYEAENYHEDEGGEALDCVRVKTDRGIFEIGGCANCAASFVYVEDA